MRAVCGPTRGITRSTYKAPLSGSFESETSLYQYRRYMATAPCYPGPLNFLPLSPLGGPSYKTCNVALFHLSNFIRKTATPSCQRQRKSPKTSSAHCPSSSTLITPLPTSQGRRSAKKLRGPSQYMPIVLALPNRVRLTRFRCFVNYVQYDRSNFES
jgi:hypothetical protein